MSQPVSNCRNRDKQKNTVVLFVCLYFFCFSRFLRHVPVIYVDYPGPASLTQIYGTFNRAMLRIVPPLRSYAQPLTDAMVEFYSMSQVCSRSVMDAKMSLQTRIFMNGVFVLEDSQIIMIIVAFLDMEALRKANMDKASMR